MNRTNSDNGLATEQDVTIEILNPYNLREHFAKQKIRTFTPLVEKLQRAHGENLIEVILNRRGGISVRIKVYSNMLIQHETCYCEHLKDSQLFINHGFYLSTDGDVIVTNYVLGTEFKPNKHY